jgi:hypothetical protein
VQDGVLFMLQTRNGKRTGPATLKIAVGMWRKKLIAEEQHVRLQRSADLHQAAHDKMALAPRRPFQRRPRLTKHQELLLCDRRRQLPGDTYADLAAWAQEEFMLASKPSKQMIARVLHSEARLRRLTSDCLARCKPRPPFQLQLDRCIVE